LSLLLLVACAGMPLRPDDPRLAGMVRVPGGAFIMGHDPGDGRLGVDVAVDSVPARKVHLPEFWIDRTEVTVSAYRRFIHAAKDRSFPLWAYTIGPPLADEPAIAVDYDDARAYCAWAGKRLPTEAEWEKAARGTDGRLYPWGNTWHPEWVVHGTPDTRRPAPVGSHPENASPYGALDMAGNVMEWTDTWYDKPPGSTLERQAFGTQYRVLKGGSWESAPVFARAANRFAVFPVIGQPSFGLRCALSGKR
jgi:formylglycine-generating enzyme required for sulfatase activity